MIFIILTYQTSSLQIVVSKKMIDIEEFQQLKKITTESVLIVMVH